VTIRVVVEKTPIEPQDLLYCERIAQTCLDCTLIHPRVSIGVEQALPCGQAAALAIHVDRSSFENPGKAEHRETGQAPNAFGDLGIVIEEVLAPPPIEAKSDSSSGTIRSGDEKRSRVSQPYVAVRNTVEERRHLPESIPRSALLVSSLNQNVKGLAAPLTSHLVDIGYRFTKGHESDLGVSEVLTPQVLTTWPREPACCVGLPLG
jgi:hypothetical protein